MASEILVIGGGAAGMMAAITAARAGKSVILLEKNDRLGKKLLITGKGRCNVTNDCTADEVLKNTLYFWSSFLRLFYIFITL